MTTNKQQATEFYTERQYNKYSLSVSTTMSTTSCIGLSYILSIINSSSDNGDAILFSYRLSNFVSKYLKWTWEVWGGFLVHLVINASYSVGDELTFILSLKYRKQPSKWVYPCYIFLMIVAYICNNGKFYMSHSLGGMYWHPCIFSAWAVGYIRSDPLLRQRV